MNIFKRKAFHVGGGVFAFLLILGFIGTTPICNWNPVEASVVHGKLCNDFAFIYIIYFIFLIIASPINGLLWGNNPVDVTHWATRDFVIEGAKYSIVIIIIGYIIGGFIGLLVGKIANKFKKSSL